MHHVMRFEYFPVRGPNFCADGLAASCWIVYVPWWKTEVADKGDIVEWYLERFRYLVHAKGKGKSEMRDVWAALSHQAVKAPPSHCHVPHIHRICGCYTRLTGRPNEGEIGNARCAFLASVLGVIDHGLNGNLHVFLMCQMAKVHSSRSCKQTHCVPEAFRTINVPYTAPWLSCQRMLALVMYVSCLLLPYEQAL